MSRCSRVLLSAVLFAVPGQLLAAHDPLALARASTGQIVNREAVIPVQCYTRTDGKSNPCWTCHTQAHGRNQMDDWDLQEEYAFSELGMTNQWSNLFKDRTREIARITDEEVAAYIREDNYTPLMQALAKRPDYRGWRPDIDFRKGFDEEGFAKDGSWWRAFKYKPFLGTFWPTNGSTDDVFIRLPWQFYTDGKGNPSRAIYRLNLAFVEAALTVPDTVADEAIRRRVEKIDESIAGYDLNGDSKVRKQVDQIVGLPKHYVGAASSIPVTRHLYPAGTEFLHTVRYVDPDSPSLLSNRMKEVRYSVKRFWTETQSLTLAYTEEKDHKERGLLPHYIGEPEVGLLNEFGWQLQGFIEDKDGRLRLQTNEEHYYCMGCHGTIGVTVDQTFGFPRKLPGKRGWTHQTLAGIQDVPQAGHAEPEILTYFKRVGGGDEFRENMEVLWRFFPEGKLDEVRVRRAAPGGDKDISWLLKPSPKRALALNKAYWLIVREQSYTQGRDTLLQPARNVHKRIENGATGFSAEKGIFRDGRLWVEWPDN